MSSQWVRVRLLALAGAALLSLGLSAQTTPPPPPPPPSSTPPQAPANPNAPEMTTRDEATSFKARVSLVMVPVVVRDGQGRAIGNLTKENFQLFDKGKPQEITRFSVERPGEHPVPPAPGQPAATPLSEAQDPPVVVADRFVAYLFDDVHLSPGDLSRIRDAADRHMGTLRPTDRAAVYTLSGQLALEFTDNRAQLHDALFRLKPGIMVRVGALNDNFQRTYISLNVVKNIIRRMSVAPGQRTIMFISPGFLTLAPEYFQEKTEILDLAIRSNVVISSLDARGLYTDPSLDVSRASSRGGPNLTTAMLASDILAELAYGTGGGFFQNSNDLDEGFRRLAAAPEYIYLLGFNPQNLKSDGSFHQLKVTLKNFRDVNLQARKGYYAPRKQDDAEETARQEIESALFSREEIREIPADLTTQFFKAGEQAAKVTVMIHVDMKPLHFRKSEGRNRDDLTLVAGLFDRNGNYLHGIKKVIEMRLKDETLVRLQTRGITVRDTFDVKPGIYLVRMVVRDAEGQLMSAGNGAVNIP